MSIFINRSDISSPPWSVRQPKGGAAHELCDANGHMIARFPGFNRYLDEKTVLANLQVIQCAPELLGALRAAAYHLHVAGIPLHQEYYDLINRASPGLPPLSRPPV